MFFDNILYFLYPPPSSEAVYCLICSPRRVAVARYQMICLVLLKQMSCCLIFIKTFTSKFDIKGETLCPQANKVLAYRSWTRS